jgi:hypothetical protein
MSEESFGKDEGNRILEATIRHRLVSGLTSKLDRRRLDPAPPHPRAKRAGAPADAGGGEEECLSRLG